MLVAMLQPDTLFQSRCLSTRGHHTCLFLMACARAMLLARLASLMAAVLGVSAHYHDSAAALESDMTLMLNNAKVVWETDSETYADAQSLAETLSEVMQAVNEGEGGLYRYHRKVADPRHMTDEQARMLLEWWEAYAAENSPWQEVSTAQRLELADKIGLQVKWALESL